MASLPPCGGVQHRGGLRLSLVEPGSRRSGVSNHPAVTAPWVSYSSATQPSNPSVLAPSTSSASVRRTSLRSDHAPGVLGIVTPSASDLAFGHAVRLDGTPRASALCRAPPLSPPSRPKPEHPPIDRQAERPERGGSGGWSGRASRGHSIAGSLARQGASGGRVDGLGGFGAVSHPVAVATDVDDVTAVEEAVQESGGHDLVVRRAGSRPSAGYPGSRLSIVDACS